MSSHAASPADATLSGLRELLPDLEKLYKDVHSHPELSMQESRTAGIAAARLKAAGYEVTTGVGKTGVVGVLRNGDGPTVMLRADMDAFPVKEATGLPYASSVSITNDNGETVPVMHACGHDMHVTWLAGAAALLAQHRDAWKGTLMPVFQPGEETAQGAQAMVVCGTTGQRWAARGGARRVRGEPADDRGGHRVDHAHGAEGEVPQGSEHLDDEASGTRFVGDVIDSKLSAKGNYACR